MRQTKEEIIDSLEKLEAERKELLNLERNKTAIIRQEIEEQKRITTSLKAKEAIRIKVIAELVEEQNKQKKLTAGYQEQLNFLKLLEEEGQAAVAKLEIQVEYWMGEALAAMEVGALSQKDLERIFLGAPPPFTAPDASAQPQETETQGNPKGKPGERL